MPSRPMSAGLAFALAAYGLWGLIPLYFKAIASVAPPEVLAHRVIWSFIVLAVIMTVGRQWPQIKCATQSYRTFFLLVASTLLIGGNWLLFIYAVASGQVLQSSLGYFVTPLANVMLGVVFLGERLRRLQWLSFLLAAAAMVVPIWLVGEFPWLAIGLASTFSVYGLMKKLAPIGGLPGLTVETLMLLPFAAVFLGWLVRSGQTTAAGSTIYSLLMFSGIATTVPLLFFAGAARRLEMKTLGIVQYLTPTLQGMLAVFLFGETLSMARIVSFVMIWSAIGLYFFDSYLAHSQRTGALQPAVAEATLPVEEPV